MTAEALRDERLRLVGRLERLTEPDWERPSLCAGWTVKHVVAHLTIPFAVGPPAMALAVARHRSIGRAMDVVTRRLAAEREPAELLTVLRDNAGSRVHPPGLTLSAPLTDAVAHSADIRWALGDPVADWDDPARLRPVLDFLTSPRAIVGFVPPGRVRGVTLVATDQDWRRGSGAVVEGPSIVLALGILGRDIAVDALAGEGVAQLSR